MKAQVNIVENVVKKEDCILDIYIDAEYLPFDQNTNSYADMLVASDKLVGPIPLRYTYTKNNKSTIVNIATDRAHDNEEIYRDGIIRILQDIEYSRSNG